MTSSTSPPQLEAGIQSAVDAQNGEPGAFAIELKDVVDFNKAGQTSAPSLEQGESGGDAGSATAEADKELKGIKFATLYSCILLGAFFTGYGRIEPSQMRYHS